MKKFNIPLSDEEIKSLRAGDIVYLTGTIYTGRDAAHARLIEAINKNESMPFDMQGAVIYYVGPSPTKPSHVIGACGPTSSYRMDPYSKDLMKKGLKIMIGKGPRSDEYKQQLIDYGAVYLSAIGGAAASISMSVKESELIAYPDLGAEAIYQLVVEDFYAIVTYDTMGNDLFEQGINAYKKRG